MNLLPQMNESLNISLFDLTMPSVAVPKQMNCNYSHNQSHKTMEDMIEYVHVLNFIVVMSFFIAASLFCGPSLIPSYPSFHLLDDRELFYSMPFRMVSNNN